MPKLRAPLLWLLTLTALLCSSVAWGKAAYATSTERAALLAPRVGSPSARAGSGAGEHGFGQGPAARRAKPEDGDRLALPSCGGTQNDPWGVVLSDTNPGFQPFGFAGGLYDSDTGLVHFGARDYDPSLGRFIAKDPSGLAGGLNVYVYAANDPINFIDSDGHFAILVPIAVGALAGALDGAAFGIAVSLATSGCVDWGDVGTSAVAGGVLGGISGGVGGWLAGGAARGAGALESQLPEYLYHYTSKETAALIESSALGQAGRTLYLTPSGGLSPIQAGIELALPQANTAGALFRVPTSALEAGGILRVGPVTGNVLGRGGGGIEVLYSGEIPLNFVARVR